MPGHTRLEKPPELASHRGLSANTSHRLPRTRRTPLTKGVGYGHHRLDHSRPRRRAARQHADPGKRSQGLILTCLIGIAGALGGGWVATKLFHIHSLQGFFNLSTWLTAIAGSAVLLLACHLLTGRSSSRSGRSRWFAHR